MMQISTVAFCLIAATVLAQGSEVAIGFKDLPDLVQRTAREQSKGAVVRGYSKETENGKTLYEVQTQSSGKSKDLLLDETGAVVEVEQQVDFSRLPSAVQAGLRTQAGSGKLLSVESVTSGTKVSYEAVVSQNGKKHEIAVGSDGALKKPECMISRSESPS